MGEHNENVENFKEILYDFAIKRNFNFSFIKKDKHKVTVICVVVSYQWHVHASREGCIQLHIDRIWRSGKWAFSHINAVALLVFSLIQSVALEQLLVQRSSMGWESYYLFSSKYSAYFLPLLIKHKLFGFITIIVAHYGLLPFKMLSICLFTW